MPVGPDDVIELRPVISEARHEVQGLPHRRHPGAAPQRQLLCPHFVDHIHRQVAKTIHHYRMFRPSDRLVLGVSGGKDSLALWDILTELGYRVDGVYLHLGIGEYSSDSLRFTQDFAEARDLDLKIVDLPTDVGFSIPQAAAATARTACSACGLSKRYILNQVAAEGGYDVLVMGHNLDDEAATLFGNVLQWNPEYLARQAPVLLPTTAA